MGHFSKLSLEKNSLIRWNIWTDFVVKHYNDIITGAMASQITSLTIVYLTAYSGADQRKHQSSASLAFVRGIHWGPVNSQHKWPVTQKMFPFYDVIMTYPAKEVICSWGAGVFARTLPHQVRCCSSPISSVPSMVFRPEQQLMTNRDVSGGPVRHEKVAGR